MKMKSRQVLLALFAIALLHSCTQKEEKKIIRIENTSATDREFETVELTADFLKTDALAAVGVKDLESDQLMVTQGVDSDGDQKIDLLLFQPKIGANSTKEYEIITLSAAEQPKSEAYCYSRFVPERTDDYAWENNRVAFRMYGPTAQKMAEDGVAGGTLSSGVDAWLKRVEHPIINKWYSKETDTEGTYHEDTGEGLDNFHVGVSRGVGGVAVKKDSTYFVSKNYTKWKTITTGPIRTSFQLEIGDWNAAGMHIKESKIISLDYGSNLSKFDVTISGTPEISAGLTLHEKDGEVSANEKKAWVSYWQPHEDSELGTAIVTTPGYFKGYETYDVPEKDHSNAYAHLKVKENKVRYYAGFTWKKSKQFANKQAWEQYLNTFADQLQTPLKVTLKGK